MTRRYKDAEGNYLDIFECDGGFYLAWYIPEDDDVGECIGERPPSRLSKDAWEGRVLYETVKQFTDRRDSTHGFLFDSMNKAKQALRAANEALRAKAPTPEWMAKALEAGWRPPAGQTVKPRARRAVKTKRSTRRRRSRT